MTSAVEVDEAYQHCERVTRDEARNFSYGIRLLPPTKRRALSAVYALARRIDDIGDSPAPAPQRLAALAMARDQLAAATVDDVDPVLAALSHAASTLPIPLGAFDDLMSGCEADVRGTRYETFDQLVQYCRCVAGSIGRLSLGVFGCAEPDRAEPLADALGVALQLTNILRDVREDRLNGRIYLPTEDLRRFGCRLELTDGVLGDPVLDDPVDAYAALVAFEAGRAHQWYERGMRLLPLLDRRSAACCAAMAGIYARLLDRIVADPSATTRTRIALPRHEKVEVAIRSMLNPSMLVRSTPRVAT